MPRNRSGSNPASSDSSSDPGQDSTLLPSKWLTEMMPLREAPESQPRGFMFLDLDTLSEPGEQTSTPKGQQTIRQSKKAIDRLERALNLPGTSSSDALAQPSRPSSSSQSVLDEQPAAKKRRTSSPSASARIEAASAETTARPSASTRAAAQLVQTPPIHQTQQSKDSPSRQPKRRRSPSQDQH
ncbi:hypothetical protein CMQ_4259 [Grosmannia clavigera kw1407]|uniref:Uncharacterized protein n=1 Tax=Grosmannia clavigera (strain kw1407 / UAMH 11150) TaxID=655863 RepID=F0XUV6_GROCL|nr:uncharacterized protein CMQ_4259 [Grosmannia clavigera kw1407]EFW98407.1 hypothetical protein CMQ_4259 [Grosmannia clavigera kw1407]